MQPFDHFQNVKDRVKFEEQGWIFEVSAYYAMVRKRDEEYILDYEHKFSSRPLQKDKDAQYEVHLNMAVQAIKSLVNA